uniref:Uncharacterized protein n=1 Tax=Rhodnius prolixus TaxID=13249 RepID=T1HKZ9_RHOPR
MATDSKQNLKQLRVDNWAVFFLQRLQLLFAKGDCCDLTLKFVSGQELKVHRLVLSTSTSFFESMESNGNIINLPESLPYSVVQPIINFLYSGRLEFKAELHSQLLAIAKIMKLAILARILIAQKNENGVGDHLSPSSKVVDIKKVQIKTPSPNKTSTSSSYVNIIAGKNVKDEEPGPTRFEWPDEESCNNMLMATPSFTSLSYESAPVITPSTPPRPSSPPSLPPTSLKRRVMPPVSSIPDKIFKADGNTPSSDNELKNPDNIVSENTNVSDDDDDDDGHFETIHTYGDSDDDIEDTPSETESPVSSLKPILKPMTDTPLQTPSKKVRFSFAPEDKENKNEKTAENVETPQQKSSEKKGITNHAKIIQEVLKKYPDLVKNNKNIKLKITAPSSASKQNTVTPDTKKRSVQSKSSYIVLKSTVKNEAVTPSSSESTEKPPGTTPLMEKIKGPWKCETCVNGNDPLKFESYYEFRKHLQETHSEKGDSKICEYCGYKASKRNLHLYHLYTKHGVDPPKNVKFPKCTQCSYIALSESLLVKHLNSHQIAKDLTCQLCNTTFRTYSSLHVHSLTCKPNSEVRSYPCPNCKKIFKTNVSLNAHVKVCTVNQKDADDGGGGSQSNNDVIEVPIIETVEMSKGEHALVQIPSGIILTETPNVALLPSSESEALNNVASSIATSIGLTVAIPQEHQQAVILLDGNSQFFLQGNESVVVSHENDVEEYIVPELLRDEMGQIYTTQNVPYTVSSTGVITCPVMSIQSTNEMDKGKESESSSTTLISAGDHNYADGELKDRSDLNIQTSILGSPESHLESSNTRVEIKDSHAEDIVAELEKALQSPEPPSDTLEDNTVEATSISNTCIEDPTVEHNPDVEHIEPVQCAPSDEGSAVDISLNSHSEIMSSETSESKTNVELMLSRESESNVSLSETTNIESDRGPEEVKTDSPLKKTTLIDIETNESDKAISLVRDWGFDNEEDTEDDVEDSEIKPSRPTVDF